MPAALVEQRERPTLPVEERLQAHEFDLEHVAGMHPGPERFQPLHAGAEIVRVLRDRRRVDRTDRNSGDHRKRQPVAVHQRGDRLENPDLIRAARAAAGEHQSGCAVKFHSGRLADRLAQRRFSDDDHDVALLPEPETVTVRR